MCNDRSLRVAAGMASALLEALRATYAPLDEMPLDIRATYLMVEELLREALEPVVDGRLRVGLCPTCDAMATMRFLGVQDGWEEIPERTLWLCGSCQTSVTGSRFLPADVEADLRVRYGPEKEGDDGGADGLAAGGGLVFPGGRDDVPILGVEEPGR